MPGSAEKTELRELCRRCGEGDEDAFSEVYRRYSRRIYGTALRMLRDPHEAEDVMQQTFLTLHRRAAELQPRNLGGWLHRVASNDCIDRIRRRQRRDETELLEGVHSAPRRHSRTSRLDLEEAVDQLPEGARQIFLLHDVEGYKHREVAEMLGISEGTSKSQLFRAREALRESLGAGGGRS